MHGRTFSRVGPRRASRTISSRATTISASVYWVKSLWRSSSTSLQAAGTAVGSASCSGGRGPVAGTPAWGSASHVERSSHRARQKKNGTTVNVTPTPPNS